MTPLTLCALTLTAALALALIALVIGPGLAHRVERWQRRRGR